MKENKIIVLERFNQVTRAEIIKALLESNGIPCQLSHELIQTVLPYTSSGAAPVELLINEQNLEQAQSILEAQFSKEEFKELTKKQK